MRSMTGYGRCHQQLDGWDVTVELKSVNHRFFEYSSRLPRNGGFLDDKLKALLQKAISRGKVEVNVSLTSVKEADNQVTADIPLARSYADALHELAEALTVRDDCSVVNIARFPDVLTIRRADIDEDSAWEAVRQTAQVALDSFVAMREREGAHLRADILSRRDALLEGIIKVEKRSPETVREHMEKVTARMRELLDTVTVDEQRLLVEAGLFADKIATAEETVRLRSHLDQLQSLADSTEPVGKRLDFLVQEMNRETNTIGSKAQDLQLAQVVIDMKSDIEKIREQIQNVE